MKYWLFITDAEGWTTIQEKHQILLPEKKGKKVRNNHKVVVYVKGRQLGGREVSPPRIQGIFTVVSDPSQNAVHTIIKERKHTSIPVKPTLILHEDFLAFRELILNLQFIENKDRWSSYLKEQMVEIPKQDYNFIKMRMNQRE